MTSSEGRTMARKALLISGLSALLLCCGMSGIPAGEAPAGPAKGEPYPGDGAPFNYEDVLDRSDLVLTGKVVKMVEGRIELEDLKVLRGRFEGKTAALSFSGSWADSAYQPPVEGQAGAFFCLREKDGALRLAGNPPKGGGFVAEGVELVEKLFEAAKDPRKGYDSKDAAVRLSSACRLAKAWTAAPEDKKPELPAGIVEVCLAGLDPGPLQGRQVNSAARYALNSLLDCDLNRLARYSTNQDDDRRKACAALARDIWDRTVAKIEARRSGAPAPPPDDKKPQAVRLVAQLGDDSFEKREAAQDELVKLGKPAVKIIEEGTRHKDAEIAARCAAILEAFKAAAAAIPPDEQIFDLDRAERFVPKPESKSK
jgi:hypothetical protein